MADFKDDKRDDKDFKEIGPETSSAEIDEIWNRHIARMQENGMSGFLKEAPGVMFRLVHNESSGWIRMMNGIKPYLHIELIGVNMTTKEDVILARDTYIPLYSATFGEWLQKYMEKQPIKEEYENCIKQLTYTSLSGNRTVLYRDDADMRILDGIPENSFEMEHKEKLLKKFAKFKEKTNILFTLPPEKSSLGIIAAYHFARVLSHTYSTYADLLKATAMIIGIYLEKMHKKIEHDDAEGILTENDLDKFKNEANMFAEYGKNTMETYERILHLMKDCEDVMLDISEHPEFPVKEIPDLFEDIPDSPANIALNESEEIVRRAKDEFGIDISDMAKKVIDGTGVLN